VGLLEKITSLDKDIRKKEAWRKRLLKKWANDACPLCVGEVVLCVGYSYRGCMGRITAITPHTAFSGEYEWRVTARVQKSDGTDSKNTTTFTQSQWENIKRAGQ
jgi:hypothetical protein